MPNNNIYVGIDLHKLNFTYVMLSSDGRQLSSGQRTTQAGDIADFASSLDSRHRVVLEPIENCFWFIGFIRPYAGSVSLANSYKVRLIAESRLKNDRIDARILADLLRVGYLPESYIPDDQIISWRRLIKHRIQLVRDRTRIKNRIISLISREGHRFTVKDAFCKRGREEMDSFELTRDIRKMVDSNLIQVDLLTAQIDAYDKEIEEIGESDDIIKLLCSIDGISYFTGLAIRAAVGEISRFKSAKSFAAYTGLIPGYRSSAGTTHQGHITKRGVSYIRWVLIQSVKHAVRHSEYMRRLYQRISFRSSVGKARVAVAHALARIIYHVWSEARPYYR